MRDHLRVWWCALTRGHGWPVTTPQGRVSCRHCPHVYRQSRSS